ncbi:mucin-binding protein, partial [Limosilactobacillus mucosae]
VTIPLYSGYTAKIGDQIITSTNNKREMTMTTGAGSDMEVVYTADTQKAQVQIFDDDAKDSTLPIWQTELSGTTAEAVDFTVGNDQLKYFLSHGYQLAANGNNDLDGKRFKTAYYDNVDGVDQTFVAHLVHGKRTFNFGDPQPTGKMYSDDENSPAWPTMTLSEDATQTIKYTGAGTNTPGNKMQTAKDAFKRTATVDLVTGKVEYSTFSGNNVTFNPETTDVVPGYHVAESNKTAGGLTATH